MLKPVFENPWVRAGALLGALAAIAAVAFMLKSVLIPLFFAFTLAYIFDPLVDRFEARYKSRTWAVLALVFGFVFVLILLPLTVVPGIISQAEELVSAAANPKGDQWLNRVMDTLPLDRWVVALGWAEPGEEDLNARAVIAEKLGAFVKENAVNFLKQNGQSLLSTGEGAGNSAAAFFAGLQAGVFGMLGFFGNFVLFTFVAIYLLKDYDQIIATADTLVPPRMQARVRDLARKVDGQLRGFLRGQLTVCLFLGLIYTLGLSVAGTPFAVPLGIFGGVASFIPYVGIVITLLPAFFLTLLQYGLDWHLLFVMGTFGVAQVLEGNFVTPKFVGEQVGLGPVWVILAIMVFSSTFGFVGLLLALPTAAVLKVFVEEGLHWYKASAYFMGEAPTGGTGESPG